MHLWSLGVGLVISGEYFGWSYGWGIAGTLGFLISTLIVSIMYTTLVFSFTELTTSIPSAAGPFEYAKVGLGPWAGFLAGYSVLVEFLFAPPAIAFALGSYVHFIYNEIPTLTASILLFFVFSGINLLGVHYAARLELLVTMIAVLELLIFIALVAPHFSMSNFKLDWFPEGVSGIFAAIPYAIWFFLAIEGIAMSAEEVKNPKRNIPVGYISAIMTLLFLSVGVMLSAGGAGDWKKLSTLDYPIPEAMAMALGYENLIVKAFAGIGIFGLIASINGIIYSASRQIFALARAGFLPKILARVGSRTKAPYCAVFICFGVGLLSLLSGKTNELITLSAMGAVLMYMISMISLFALRIRQPNLQRPFKAPLYPYFPAIALALSLLSLLAIIYYNPKIAVVFIVAMIPCAAVFFVRLHKGYIQTNPVDASTNCPTNNNPTLIREKYSKITVNIGQYDDV